MLFKMNPLQIKVIAVIPAKSDSTRLPNKNMRLLNGNPLLYYTIKYAQGCPLLNAIFVSTDCEYIAEYARSQRVGIIMRSTELSGDVPLINVYAHAFHYLNDNTITHIAGLQPDHPDRHLDLKEAIQYSLDKNLDDLGTVDEKGHKNGSIKILKTSIFQNQDIRVHMGTLVDSATNIHTKEDLALAEARLNQQSKI